MGLRPNDGIIDNMLMNGILPEVAYSDLEFYECLSAGTFGTVYRAKYLPQNQIVAVKRVLVLEKEAHVLSLLRHKNIIQFYGAVTHPPNFCIVLEYASKGSLHAYLADKSNQELNFSLILRWANDIALGVHYLHTEAPVKMIHRDLKSKNVVISADDTCKLCDFGTSKAILHTTQMSVVGTIAWMSPEMIQSLPVAESTDTWSYAVVLWELLTHQIPFKGLEAFRIAWMIVEENVRLPIPTSCPTKFADIMRDSWNKDPKLRPTFIEILRRLQEIKSDKTSSSETDAYLNKKEHWKQEIDDNLDVLKQKERELTDREAKLSEWETRLARREQNIETNRRFSPQLNYDVNLWYEDDVIAWLHGLQRTARINQGAAADFIGPLIDLFRVNHINGQRLLMLTDNDLRNLGINSVGYRRQLITEIDRLARDNLRLINFPPLAIAAKAPKNNDRLLNVTLLFGIYVRQGLGLSTHKWKLLMDVDDADSCDDANALINEVRFVVQDAPYVYKVSEAPFVMSDWSIGFSKNLQVQCIVTFSDLVRKPRNTKYLLDIEYDNRGTLSEKLIELHVKTALPTSTTMAQINNMSYSRSVSDAPHQSTLGSHLHPVQSSPALQGVWQEKFFREGVPSPSHKVNTPQKSPLWAQIVAGLKDNSPENSSTSSTIIPRNNSDPSLNQTVHKINRTVSEDVTSPKQPVFFLGKSISVDEYDAKFLKNVNKIKVKTNLRQNNETKPKYVELQSPVTFEKSLRKGRRNSKKSIDSSPTPRLSSSSDSEELNSPVIAQQQNQRSVNRSESDGYFSQTSMSPEVRLNNSTILNNPSLSLSEHRRSLPVSFDTSSKRPQSLFEAARISFPTDRISAETLLSPVLERVESGHFEPRSSQKADQNAPIIRSGSHNKSSKRRRPPSQLSSTSVAIHGGNQKWKWKGV